ncbi:unnamed protein product [Prunus armeniaca]
MSTQFQARVKAFLTHNGGEYVNNTLAYFFRAQVARSPILDMSVPHHLWGHAVLSAAYLINRTPSWSKLDPCALHCVFVGYSSTQKGYKCYHSPTQTERGNELENLGLELENDVFEDIALGKERTDRTKARDRSSISEDKTCGLCEETIGRPLELDQSPIYGDEVNVLGVETTNRIEASDRSPVSKESDSDSYAMNVQMEALNKNETWDLVPLLRGKKATYGVNYLETFAPIAKLNIVCVLLSLAASRDWPLLQFDVNNVFVHGDLKEEIYMDLPPGIPMTSKESVVRNL